MDAHAVEVRQAGAREALSALELLLQGVPTSERKACAAELLADLPQDSNGIGGLFLHGINALAGVALAQLHPGRTASVWRPRFAEDVESASHAVALLRHCDHWAASQQARLSQTLLELEDVAARKWFSEAGYTRLARLAYLCWSATAPPPQEQNPLNFAPLREDNAAFFSALLEQTYEGTLDCPALNGVRETAEVLEGYRAIGTYRDDFWLLASMGGETVGCLLLADHPISQQVELVYMGVAPGARGRGFGSLLIAEAQRQTARAGRERLVLAADTANLPALRQYQRAGFGVWDQREVYARVLCAAKP